MTAQHRPDGAGGPSANGASTTLHITLPVGPDDPLVDQLAWSAMAAAQNRGLDAIVMSESDPAEKPDSAATP